MKVDVHTHIFTLRTVLTNEATRVMTERLRHRGVPKILVEAIEGMFQSLLEKPQYLDESNLLRMLIGKISGVPNFDAMVGRHVSTDWFGVTIGADLAGRSADALSDILTKMVDAYDGGGKAELIANVIQALRMSMKGTITDVADDILGAMDDDEIIVALMLDIYGPSQPARDRKAYRDQILGTAEAAVQRPGRILPFFGVHPDRPEHLDELRSAVEGKGFVGVKLYPSLGYKVDSPEMRRVYEYCVEKDLPVLLHCGHGGFFRTEEAKGLCDPAQWKDLLADAGFRNLRVCFAHFGGWEAMGKRHCFDENWPPNEDKKGNWGKKIRDFMIEYPNVYTDLAKHVGMFDKDEDRRTYFDTMRELIADPKIGKRILYGSDAWLLRLDMPFHRYRQMWQEAAGASMSDIAGEAPLAFLGFPTSGLGMLPSNLARFVAYMRANRHRFGKKPAPWLRQHLTEPYTVVECPPDWDFDRLAVRDTYQFLGQYMTDRQVEEGHIQNRLIQLRELPYFDKADPNFGGRCRDLARRFIDFADQDMEYAPGHSFGSAVDLFIEIFREGELRFSEVARVLDTVIDYPEAIS